MVDNGILENRPGYQSLDSFVVLNSNIPFSSSTNLVFIPFLDTRSQVNFFVETHEICKQVDKTPEILYLRILMANLPNLLQ